MAGASFGAFLFLLFVGIVSFFWLVFYLLRRRRFSTVRTSVVAPQPSINTDSHTVPLLSSAMEDASQTAEQPKLVQILNYY